MADTNKDNTSSGSGDDDVQKPEGKEEKRTKMGEEDKSFLADLLSKVWSYHASGGMVAFWFVLLTMGGVGVIYAASDRWSWVRTRRGGATIKSRLGLCKNSPPSFSSVTRLSSSW